MEKRIKNEKVIDTSKLYRMPWTMADNSNTWLEITRDCDITCEYCVQEHEGTSHKTLGRVQLEIKQLMKLRKCDSMLIAGGEPLIHPQLLDIIRTVKDYKVKPMIITNGVSLDEKFLRELKEAGLRGFILHVDSGQHRPGYLNQNEKELNALRQKYANMIYKVGGMVCSFITTITPKALPHMKDIVQWMSENTDKVTQNIFVPVRGLYEDGKWEYAIDSDEINLKTSALYQEEVYEHLMAEDLAKEVQKVLPNYQYNAFLGGTQLSNAPKWAFGIYISQAGKFVGNVGPKGMEMIQNLHHLFKGKFLSFMKPWVYRSAWLLFVFALFDRQTLKTVGRFLLSVLKNPLRLFKRLSFQSIIVMQPFDILENGESDICDGCPNKTYWNGRLVSECRMEEYLNYGKQIQFSPKKLCSMRKIG